MVVVDAGAMQIQWWEGAALSRAETVLQGTTHDTVRAEIGYGEKVSQRLSRCRSLSPFHLFSCKELAHFSTAQIQIIRAAIVARSARYWHRVLQQSKRGVGEIVVENLPETAALLSHALCAALTETDAVSLADTFQDHLLALLA
jgi:hypothetical protein